VSGASAPRVLVWASGLGAVVAAAVVCGAVLGTVLSVEGERTPVTRPPVALPLPGPTAGVQAAPAPRPSAPTADRPAPAGRSTRVDLGQAGSVRLTVRGGLLVVDGVDAAAGWSVHTFDQRARQVEVRLRSGHGEARLEASLAGGEIVPRVRLKDR
jgi:hypothetical protein